MGTKTGVIGVLATAGTLKGSKYINNKGRVSGNVKIVERVGDGFVELVESGILSGPEAEATVRSALEPLLREGADRIVLGCTHYPFLLGTLSKVASDLGYGNVEFIDPAPAVARRLVDVLAEKEIGTSPKGRPEIELLSSGSDEALKRTFTLI